MHLGLIDGPFLPHNLISAQQSPASLPKFQMAPRLKILMSSGSKKRTQIYCPFLSKGPGKRIPSRFPNGAPIKTDTHLQSIFTSLLIYLFISKALRKERPLWKQMTIPEPCLIYLLGSPGKQPSVQVPLMESPWREMPRSFIHHSKSPVYEPPPPDSRFPSDVKGPIWREMPCSFIHHSKSPVYKQPPLISGSPRM